MIEIPALGGSSHHLWTLLLDLADTAAVPWTLVGGQMTFLHGLQAGKMPPRISSDLDTVIDVRAEPTAMRSMVATLEKLDMVPAGNPGPNGLMHGYRQLESGVIVDVLAPEGIGARADISTSHGGRAFTAPGASQALARTSCVPVRYEERVARVPLPSLTGAVVGKAVAVAADKEDNERHIRDLEFLCSLGTPEDLTSKDRKRLHAAARSADLNGWGTA